MHWLWILQMCWIHWFSKGLMGQSFLYIISCHLQMIITLLLHIQFEYFLLSLADVLSVILQLQSDQEWQERALSFFINLTRRIFNFLLPFNMTLAVGLICDVWFCWDTFDISCSESCVFFFCHRIMVFHMLFFCIYRGDNVDFYPFLC